MNDGPIWDEASGTWLYEIDVSEDVLTLITAAAQAEGLTVDQFVEKVVREMCLTQIKKEGPEAVHEWLEGTDGADVS